MQFSPSPASSVRASRASDGVPLAAALSHHSIPSTTNALNDRTSISPSTPSHKNSTEYEAQPADEVRFGAKPHAAGVPRVGEEANRPKPISSDSVLSIASVHPHDLAGAPVSHKQYTPPAGSPEIERPRPPMPMTSDSVLSVPSLHTPTEHHVASSTAEIRPTPTTSNSETWSTDGNANDASASSLSSLGGAGMTPAERYASKHSGAGSGERTGLEALGAPVESRASGASTVTEKEEHKLSLGEKVKGTVEKTLGKLTGNEDKVKHGEAKKRGELA